MKSTACLKVVGYPRQGSPQKVNGIPLRFMGGTFAGMWGSRLLRSMTALLVLGITSTVYAQSDEHPFIRTFELTVLDGRILVSWTMQGGSTCDGSEVLRSTNGVDFTAVHRIDGICGDAALDVPFSWMDEAPPEFSTLSYRIKLGNEGNSSIKAVEFRQLTSSQQRFFPSPMLEEATLLLNVPASAQVDLLAFDMNGRIVWERKGSVGREHSIVLNGEGPGLYSYLAVSEGKRFSGSFVKQ
jgi:hypothetical protein